MTGLDAATAAAFARLDRDPPLRESVNAFVRAIPPGLDPSHALSESGGVSFFWRRPGRSLMAVVRARSTYLEELDDRTGVVSSRFVPPMRSGEDFAPVREFMERAPC